MTDRRLAAALAGFGITPGAIVPLTARPPGVRPGAYLVTTAASGSVKLRIARTRRSAERSAAYVRLLSDPRLPAPLAVQGRMMLDAWVDGTPIAELRLDGALVDAAADLLADVHRFRGRGLPHEQSVAPIRRRLERQLAELVSAGVVRRTVAAKLERIAAGGLPVKARWGLTHGDFCAENLVLTPAGALISIDNAHLGGGFLEYDLGRSWYRWPRAGSDVERLERRYDEQAGAAPDPGERLAWRAAAAVKGLHLRHRHRWPLDLPRSAVARLVA